MKSKILALSLGAAVLSFGMVGSALADGAALFQSKGCAGCHGAGGKAPVMPVYPKLAGQNEQYLLNQMKDIKSGARSNGQAAVMKAVVAGVSDADLAEIAKYLASEK
jgi:cytochrome c